MKVLRNLTLEVLEVEKKEGSGFIVSVQEVVSQVSEAQVPDAEIESEDVLVEDRTVMCNDVPELRELFALWLEAKFPIQTEPQPKSNTTKE